MLRRRDFSADTGSVRVRLGKETITLGKREAETGYFEKVIPGDSIVPSFVDIAIRRDTQGAAWGGVHYQYFEDLSEIESDSNSLSIAAEHYVVRNTKRGEQASQEN